MASSGSFGTGNYHGRYLTFNWWTNGRSIDGNYTDIGWNLVGSGNASASIKQVILELSLMEKKFIHLQVV